MEKAGAINNILRDVMFWIDRMIYGSIPKVYNLIIDVAEAKIIQDSDIKAIANNIYVLMGLFMLFKLVFSLLNSIVNPDLLTDKEQGLGNIIQRSMIALTLVVAIPLFIFPYAFRVQSILVGRDNNIFMRLFMGVPKSDINAGQQVGGMLLSQFIECTDENYCGLDENNQPKNHDTRPVDYLIQDIEFLAPMSEALNKTDHDKNYIYKYSPLFSFPCGLFVLIMMLSFSIDVGIRTIKLGFLQIIAPIAVLSYVDPKSSKDGFFSKWSKACISTYLLLFFRMAALAFMILIIALIGEFMGNNSDVSGWVIVLLIIGALYFAKDLPKMLGDLFGIEDVGFGTLGTMLKTATGLGFGAAALGAGAITGGITGAKEGKTWGSFFKGAGMGMKSGVSSVWGAKGDVLGQAKAALSAPWQTVGAVGKNIKGEDYRWGFGALSQKATQSIKQAEYASQQRKDEKDTNKIWAQMVTAETFAKQANKDEMAQAVAKIDAEKNAYKTDNFKNAFGNYHTLKEKLKHASNDFSVIENKFRTGDASITEDKYREELIKYKKLEGSVKTAEETFATVKKTYKDDAEMYDLIRAREDAEKVTSAAAAARSSSNTGTSPAASSTGSSGQQQTFIDDKGNVKTNF